jgi:dTDP-4-dehydrorhamnose 3,5-epimerase
VRELSAPLWAIRHRRASATGWIDLESRVHFRQGRIADVIQRPLQKFSDARGWLCELFRTDELPAEFHPVMAYLSVTEPGVVRGPHEHVEQADYFCFLGPSTFKVYLWDNRKESASYQVHETTIVGEANPTLMIVPAGVVHAYKNIGNIPGLTINCPNRLYAGHGKSQPVDEIRHEKDRSSPFQVD